MAQRIREAVVRIAKVGTDDGNALPVLERSLKPLLSCASAFYCGVYVMRRALYKYGLFTASRLPVPVVSVGNITWGGNGKTPMVEALSGWFLGAGICPLILIRGYAGGDEAEMLRMHLHHSCAKLGEGPNRGEIARAILQRDGMMPYRQRKELAVHLRLASDNTSPEQWPKGDGKIGVIILDDGMQHMPLARDLDLVMVNLINLWGNKRMIPRGPLRESLQELKRADVVILHHADLVSEERLETVRNMLKQVVRDDTIVISSSMTPQVLFRLPSQGFKAGIELQALQDYRVPLEALKGSIVLCVSGIGCPEALSCVLERLGCQYIERMDYLDHHSFQAEDLADIQTTCTKLHNMFEDRKIFLVLTEKDYIRNPSIWEEVHFVNVLILHSYLRLTSSGRTLMALRELLIKVASKKIEDQ